MYLTRGAYSWMRGLDMISVAPLHSVDIRLWDHTHGHSPPMAKNTGCGADSPGNPADLSRTYAGRRPVALRPTPFEW